MKPSLEGMSTKTKEGASPHEVKTDPTRHQPHVLEEMNKGKFYNGDKPYDDFSILFKTITERE